MYILDILIKIYPALNFANLLKLDPTSKAKDAILGHVIDIINNSNKDIQQTFKNQNSFRAADWQKVAKVTDTTYLAAITFGATKTGQTIAMESENDIQFIENFKSASAKLDEIDKITELRYKYLSSLKGHFWQEAKFGQCNAKVSNILFQAVDHALHHADKSIKCWKYMQRKLVYGKILTVCSFFETIPYFGSAILWLMFDSLATGYDVAEGYIKANEESLSNLAEFTDDYEEIEQVSQEINEDLEKCKHYLKVNILDTFQDLNSDLQTRKACYALLNKQRQVIKEYFKEGLLEENINHLMKSIVESKMQSILKTSLHSKLPTLEEVISHLSFFDQFTQEQMSEIIQGADLLIFTPDKLIFKEGYPTQGVFIILRGQVKEYKSIGRYNFEITHKQGSIVGIQHALEHVNSNITNCSTEDFAYGAFIRKSLLLPFLEDHVISESMWLLATPILIKTNPDSFSPMLVDLEFDSLKQMISLCSYDKYINGDTIQIEQGGLLMYGTIKQYRAPPVRQQKRQVTFISPKDDFRPASKRHTMISNFKQSDYVQIKAYAVIDPNQEIYHSTGKKDTVIIHFSEELVDQLRLTDSNLNVAVKRMVNKRMTVINVTSQDAWQRFKPGINRSSGVFVDSNRPSKRSRPSSLGHVLLDVGDEEYRSDTESSYSESSSQSQDNQSESFLSKK